MSRPDELTAWYPRPLKPIPSGIPPMLRKIESYAAILFDVYGTLLISRAGEIGRVADGPSARDRLRKMLRRYGIERDPRELAQTLASTIAAKHRAQEKRGIVYPEVDIRQIWQTVLCFAEPSTGQRFAWEYEWITNPVFPMPGAAAVIRAGRENQVPLGIISNAQFYTEWVLADLFGKTLYTEAFNPRLRFFSWREKQAKPSGSMFQRAREELSSMGIPAESVLFVGNDMLNDIRPAAAAGFQTALFAGDRRSLRTRDNDERCRGVRPDLVVTELRQLLAAIGTPSSGG